MAKLLTLSALLSVLLSFPGASGWTGCKLPRDSVQKFGTSSMNHWTRRMQDVAEGVSFSNMPGSLLSCRADLMTCTSVRIDLIDIIGADVNVFLDTSILCRLAAVNVKIAVSLCVKLRLRVQALVLAVDGCVIVDVKVRLPPLLLSLNANLFVDIITLLLREPCCLRARKVCHELNYLYDLPEGPVVFPPNCTTVFQKHRHRISSRDFDSHCKAIVKCGGTSYPFPIDPDFTFPSIITSGDVTYYIRAVELNVVLDLMRKQHLLDTIITLVSVTTTTVMVHIPEISVPGNLPIVIKLKCVGIYVSLNPDKATLRVSLQLEVGFQDFTLLLRLTLGVALRLRLRIDCPRRLMLLSVDDDISDWQLSGSCPGRSCSLRRSELDALFGLRILVTSMLNAQLRIGIPWPLFRVYGCDSCSEAVCIQGMFYWPCKMRYPVL